MVCGHFTYGELDNQSQLIEGSAYSYAYDAMERRIAKVVDGTQTQYVYNASIDTPLAHDDIAMEFQGPFLKRRWVHSNNIDEPIGFEEYVNASGVGSGMERLIYANRQGSVIWITDPTTNAIIAAYEYDGYGQITQTQGTLVQPYGYTGREYDAESRLYYYRARAYDPAAGVFAQSDPIGFNSGDLNTYQYADNNPEKYIDPHGLSKRHGRHPAMTIQDHASAEIREAAIQAVAGGVFGLVGQIVGTLAYSDKLLQAATNPLTGEKPQWHHCHPTYLGRDNRNKNMRLIDAGKHRFLHKAMRLYLRSYDLDYAPGYGGRFIRKRFPIAHMRKITRQFYKDMRDRFDIDFGC